MENFDASGLRSIYAKMQKMLENNKKIIVENHERFKRDDVDNKIPPLNVKEELKKYFGCFPAIVIIFLYL